MSIVGESLRHKMQILPICNFCTYDKNKDLNLKQIMNGFLKYIKLMCQLRNKSCTPIIFF